MAGTATTRRTALLGGAAVAFALLVAAPTPAGALRVIGAAGSAPDPTAPLVALLSLAAWALAAWLLLTVALTAGSRIPGRLGRASRATVTRVAPAAVRRAVGLSLGLSVVLGGVGAAPAAAAPGSPAGPPAAAPALDWGAAPSQDRSAPQLDWAASPAAAPLPEAPGAQAVVVTRGDSLWQLAASDLAARSGAEPSDAKVAHAWPAWWAANREAVGDDPHLIRPGTALTPPGTAPSS